VKGTHYPGEGVKEKTEQREKTNLVGKEKESERGKGKRPTSETSILGESNDRRGVSMRRYGEKKSKQKKEAVSQGKHKIVS